jgi:hypothetical protein
MKTLDDFKQTWRDKQHSFSEQGEYNTNHFEKIIRSRLKAHIKASFQYFWASFVLQLIVYALLTHVIVKYRLNKEVLLFSFAGILLYIPFTIMLMSKFKRMAQLKPDHVNYSSLYQSINQQKSLLTSFYQFKKAYESFLVPISSAIGVFVVFELYVPGGIKEHLTGAIILFLVTLGSCLTAIISENRKSFRQPISHLENLLEEFNSVV